MKEIETKNWLSLGLKSLCSCIFFVSRYLSINTERKIISDHDHDPVYLKGRTRTVSVQTKTVFETLMQAVCEGAG